MLNRRLDLARWIRNFRMPRSALGWAAVVWAMLAAASVALLLVGWGRGSGPKAPPRAPAAAAPHPAPLKKPPANGPGVTQLATVRVAAARYAAVGRRGDGEVPSSWYDRPSVLPVIATRPGWVRVRLAQRPNGSTAWIPDKDVTLSSTPFQIVVDLATTHLKLYDNGRLVFSAPAGVGTPDDPTPTGHYFVAFDEAPPSPGYGAFIMVTSAHSESISDWEGSGDAVIGIHGPLGMDAAIGTKGARISHGCIRLHEQTLLRLEDVPAGTPIDIIK